MGLHPVVLVTGAGGQVGTALRARLGSARFMGRSELDVTDRKAVHNAVGVADLVVHLAAMTNVDECEARPDAAFAVNADGTRHVAEAAAVAGARMVYVSTDYVFDGEKAGEYEEADAPSPINVYGRSKLEGERHVAAGEANLTVRTSWIFGQGRNFVRTILGAAGRGDPLRVVADQRGRPTWAEDLAAALAFLLERSVTGIIHVAGSGPTGTWADLAEVALEAAGSSIRVERIDSETHARTAGRIVAPRPRNSALSLGRAVALGVPIGDWRRSVRDYVGTLA